MVIKNHLKFFRKRAGLTQAQLADLAHLSLSHYARMERGKEFPFGPSTFTAALLCKALKVRFEHLFYLEDENVKSN